MKSLLNVLLAQRAKKLACQLAPFLPGRGPILDLGSGTGHNALAIQSLSGLTVIEADVVNLSVVGNGPVLFDGRRLPFPYGSFAAAEMMFVLQYVPDPVGLLYEARRISRGPVLVLQSIYRGAWGRQALRTNELLWGPLAVGVARASGLIMPVPYSLHVNRLFTRPQIELLFRQAGLAVREVQTRPWPVVPVAYTLFLLGDQK